MLKPFKDDHAVINALIEVYKRDQNEHVRKMAGEVLGDLRPKSLRERPAFVIATAVLSLALVSLLCLITGPIVYQPREPLPAKVSMMPAEGIYGPNHTVTLWLRAILKTINERREAISSLQPARGEAFRIPCPRRFEDILFGKRDCEALVFRANSPTALLSVRFLVLRHTGQIRSIAIGVPKATTGSADGDFIELSEHVEDEYKELADELSAQAVRVLDSLKSKDWIELSPSRTGVYLPFVTDPDYQRKAEVLRESNSVVQHLLALASKANPDLSLGARVYTVQRAGPTGMYRPSFNLIQRPMFREPALARTIAHELVHSILDGVEDKESLLKQLLPYLKSAHAKMYEVTLPMFYEEEIPASDPQRETKKAEEMLAFFTGSLAAEETEVVFLEARPVVRDLDDFMFRTEPLLSSDLELLVLLGLVPEWMSPKTLGYDEDKITRRYYEKVDHSPQ